MVASLNCIETSVKQIVLYVDRSVVHKKLLPQMLYKTGSFVGVDTQNGCFAFPKNAVDLALSTWKQCPASTN